MNIYYLKTDSQEIIITHKKHTHSYDFVIYVCIGEYIK